MMRTCRRAAVGLPVLAICACNAVAAAAGLRAPANLASKVGFDQELGAQVPMQVLLQDVHGAAVPLQRYWAVSLPSWFRSITAAEIFATSFAPALHARLRPADSDRLRISASCY